MSIQAERLSAGKLSPVCICLSKQDYSLAKIAARRNGKSFAEWVRDMVRENLSSQEEENN
jgi:hypothetical protein